MGSKLLKIIAWGQYVHWAELQFSRVMSTYDDESISDADRIGLIAHWLASERVVLEGWTELGLTDNTIHLLITRYPEHCDVLRRCRNAVYHFQTELLDSRIAKCLLDENEELKWCFAIHYEFQRYLVKYPYLLKGSWEECNELAIEIRKAIGWHPVDTPSAQALALYEKCMAFNEQIKFDNSQSGVDARTLITSTLEILQTTDAEPLTKQLRKMQQVDRP